MPLRILIVDPEENSRQEIEHVLGQTGHVLTSFSSYADAKTHLASAQPDLLISAVRLGAYNGIQLVLRAKPILPAIILDSVYDAVLEAEASNAGAVYLARPVDAASLLGVVERLFADTTVTASAAPAARKWPRKAIDKPIVVSDAAAVVDVSYGGLRLEVSGPGEEALFTMTSVTIANVGVVAISPIWARMATGDFSRWWCGAEVELPDADIASAWRRFVDSL